MTDFYPHEIAEDYLISLGVNFDQIYNDRDGITRAQLTALSRAPFFKSDIKTNAYKTIHRLYASKNRKNINFDDNLKNTLDGTVSAGIMDTLNDDLTVSEKKQLIVWLPSTAKEQDPFHALNYGKTMTLQDAINKGLGYRYGCQCGFRTLDKKNSVKIEDFKKNAL